mgnify:CR=1 FL=1
MEVDRDLKVSKHILKGKQAVYGAENGRVDVAMASQERFKVHVGRVPLKVVVKLHYVIVSLSIPELVDIVF